MSAQVKVSGKVIDESGNPIPFVNVLLQNTIQGGITDENGLFYLESSQKETVLVFSFLGYQTKTVQIKKRIQYSLSVQLIEEAAVLNEVVLYSGRVKKKGNPAIAILKKIWSNKRKNGIHIYDQYEYDKYEKIEFDMNNIDSTMIKSKLFKGMEFVFNHVDTSRVTGKSYLPVFINEALYKTYGRNKPSLKFKEDLKANKNSGFQTNQYIISFIKDLYVEYDIYDNYILLFDKNFVSPLSKTGVNNYNYVLRDSAFLEDKWCYNIVFYPRVKGTLTFKGDFWVNDSTFAIKEINMEASKSANINWVRELYIEQSYEVLNDSVFLLKKDYIMSDFSLTSKENSKGVYGKRTTLYENYDFFKEQKTTFYDIESDIYEDEIHNKSDVYWKENRIEKLNKDEKGIYKLLDTLNTVRKFRQIYDVASVLASGYVAFPNFDYGPLFSTFGTNDIEGFRIRAGGRTYFGPNDKWRIQGYTAYGFKDQKLKYGISWKWMFRRKNRWILQLGHRKDIEQTGVSLTTSNNPLGRSFASSAFFTTGDTGKLTNVNLSTVSFTTTFKKNLDFKIGTTYKILGPASSSFNFNYLDSEGNVESETTQSDIEVSLKYTPRRKTAGNGVELTNVSSDFSTLYLSYSKGLKGVLNSDFEYDKVQLYYNVPFRIGGIGRSKATLEIGKIIGTVPLHLLNVVPGNQSYFSIRNTFDLLNYYEFVTDTYASLKYEHNFNGRIFNYIPLINRLNLREIVSAKGVWGSVTAENEAINVSSVTPYKVPEEMYIEYSFGIGNIFKVFQLNFIWRGTYLDVPETNNFGVKGSFGFYF